MPLTRLGWNERDEKMETAPAVGAAALFFLFPLMMLAVGVALTVFWIWMLVDCATKEPSEGNDKIVWVLVIVLTHWVGALIYLLARRPARVREFGR
jgi:hypothetical protein